MCGRDLEDFAVGQAFGSGRLRISRAVRAFAAEFDPQPFHLYEHAAQNTIFKDWRQAVGIRRLSPSGSWSRASSSPRAVSLAPGSTSSVGHGLCGPAMSCTSKAKCLR
jgi:acyl dehydratase